MTMQKPRAWKAMLTLQPLVNWGPSAEGKLRGARRQREGTACGTETEIETKTETCGWWWRQVQTMSRPAEEDVGEGGGG
jgi:hypothetical protein